MAQQPSRGLADVVAAATALSDIDGTIGRLSYRGYDISELAGAATFEEVAYLQAATRIRFAQGYYFAKPIFIEDLAPVRRGVGGTRSFAMPRERSSMRGRGQSSR